MRKSIEINEVWRFIREDEEHAANELYKDDHWHTVNIPHTWNAIDGANGYEYYQGACWYRKSFVVEPTYEGSKLFIEFNGSNSITDVYVNGQHLGQHKGGYSTFRFDMTDVVKHGDTNVLAVKVDNTVVDDVYPQKADFTFYGGIYRDVKVVVTNPVHFDLMDHGSQGVYVVQEEVSKESAQLTIRTHLVNDSNEEKKVRLWADIFDADHQVVTYASKEVILAAGETRTEEMPCVIDHPTLWHGRRNPYMYSANVSMTSFNDTIDEVSIPFGVRYFHVDPEKGFFLNGEHLPLHGVSRHQDRKDMGWAITEKEQVEDMAYIREIGASSIRLAHYQHSQYFYDLCDKEGMVVWAEIPFISIMSQNELEGINAKQQMVELIRQNYNHPSIVFWGIQNEIQIGGERPEVRRLVKELHDLTKKEDPTRLTTMANVLFVSEEDEYNRMTDVIGYNKYYGWYHGHAEDFAPWLDKFHRINPDVPLCISEYGAEGIVQYHSADPKVKDYTEEYHALFHETVWKTFEKRPYLWATYVWNMFDFGANIRDEGGVQGRNNKGLVSYDRKIKKDAFYMYKAHWSEEKFVHITSKRHVDRAESSMTVKVYSNCNNVVLYVNGTKFQSKISADKVFIFEHVSLVKGLNDIRAVATEDNAQYVDIAKFNKVEEPNPSYEAPIEEKGGEVTNWFQMPDLDGEIEELQFTDDVYSTRCTFKELFENKDAAVVLNKYLGESFRERPTYSMTQGFKIDTLAEMAPEHFTDKLLYALNRELTKIKMNK
ncbi:glycoside hydrolase family 2 protein [Paenibacillus sp. Soil750]|uniref:glycoside hydrolase family 2 protein n=1 Tax=Paenibacillus sp. Soil750 TaxID=1736398 RepID=UPI0006FBBAE8|nr:glycoside hydrolase family 2 TIM barrel-domain containing protein [Paenibacillus sp. Soil750]KRE68867.1 beta-galactosidase [Paenibacillus sp. Soil750]